MFFLRLRCISVGASSPSLSQAYSSQHTPHARITTMASSLGLSFRRLARASIPFARAVSSHGAMPRSLFTSAPSTATCIADCVQRLPLFRSFTSMSAQVEISLEERECDREMARKKEKSREMGGEHKVRQHPEIPDPSLPFRAN